MNATAIVPDSPERILVLAQCAFGDTLVLIPALRALRQAWPNAHIAFISEPGKAGWRVAATDVLAGTGLVDEFQHLAMPSSRWSRLVDRVRLVRLLRRYPWDLGIVLVPPVPPLTLPMVRRLSLYLKLFGARQVVAPDRILTFSRDTAGWLTPLPHVSATLLDLLWRSGVPTDGSLDLPLLPPSPDGTNVPPAAVDSFLTDRPGDGSAAALRLAVAPAAQMPAKRWPIERYVELLRRLHREWAPRFIVFGGEADREVCDRLRSSGADVVTVIGQPIPEVIAVMRRCDAYIGNDTGLMHLAAALAKPCIAVFGSRDAPGVWYPYGQGHTVFRTQIECEGCLAAVCPRGDNACLQRIGIEAVHAACQALCRALQSGRASAASPAPAAPAQTDTPRQP